MRQQDRDDEENWRLESWISSKATYGYIKCLAKVPVSFFSKDITLQASH